jgi:molybdopterin molybdotransferase
VVARHPGGWVFGLPGNPASVMVTFWLFVRPVLRRLMGLPDHFWHGALRAQLSAPLPPNKGRDRFLHTTVTFEDGRLLALPRLPRGSHDVVSYGRGNALLRLRPHAPASAQGSTCEILPLCHWAAG